MSEPFNIGQFRQKEAERFAKHMEQEDNKRKLEEQQKKLEAEKIIIENEILLLKEMKIMEELYMFLEELDNMCSKIIIADNIVDIDLHVLCFMNILENGKILIDNPNFMQEITTRIMTMINNVTQNQNSKFNITVKDNKSEAAYRIKNHIKLCLKMINYDDTYIDIELMDTQNDEEIAKKLQLEFYEENNNFVDDFNDNNISYDAFINDSKQIYCDQLAEFSYELDKSDY